MADFIPPPTYADPVIVDPVTKKGNFNPIWLNWFIQFVQFLETTASGAGVDHNNLTNLQGGAANEYYHFTSAQHTTLAAYNHESMNGLLGGSAAQHYHLDAAQHTQTIAIAGVAVAADKLIYATGANTFAATAFTAFGRSLIDDVDAAAGRTTLGLGTIATQAANNVAVTGGAIDGTAVGATTPSTGKFTTLEATSYIKGPTTTVASLPAAGTVGKNVRYFVEDATQTLTAGIGTVVIGGGVNNVPVISDGTNWRIG